MNILIGLLRWMTRALAYVLGAVLVVAVAAVLVAGFTSFGTGLIVDKVADLASTRDRVITVTGPSGLLSGRTKADVITLADTKGVFAEIRGLTIDWSPLSLLQGRFRADRVAVQSIDFRRLPVKTIPDRPTEPGSGGFSLPIAIDISSIALPDIRLGEAIAGRAFALAASGNMHADSNSIALRLDANRQDVPEAKLAADVAFAPLENRLTLKGQLAEPKGGLLAGLLRLPNDPAVNIDVSGEGPISEWAGKLQASLDGQPRMNIEGRHSLSPDGLHHIDIKGGGQFDTLLPPNFRPLFAGQTNIALSATFNGSGKIDIQTGNLATGSVVLAASGTLDPAGNNSLNANLLGTSGPVDFRWPMDGGDARFLISGINLTLTGAANAAKLNLDASLVSATLPQGAASDVKLTAKSDAFNLGNRSGPVRVRLVVGDTSFVNPDLQRLIRGPITLAAPLQLSKDAVGFNGTTLESGSIGGSVNGAYTLSSKSLTGNFKLFALPSVLPDNLAAKFDTTIAAEGQVSGTLPDRINLSNLNVKSGTLEASGNVALDEDTLSADLSGRILNLSKLIENAAGQADYKVSASGPLSALAVSANVTTSGINMVGRAITDLDITVTGTADRNAPQGNLKATGAIDGQPISIDADIRSQDGRTSIPTLLAQVGPNKLQGKLDFSPSLEPVGDLTFDFPDISLLAALGGQRANGDLTGSVNLTSDNGKIGLNVTAAGNGIHRDTLSIQKPVINLTVTDLMAFSARGSIRAGEIASGANRLIGLSLDFDQSGNRTGFYLRGDYDNAPLLAMGYVQSGGGQMVVALDSFSAAPRAIPVKLTAPTRITIAGGTAVLDGLTISTGNGSVSVSGSAGETLKIDATLSNLPASLANSFVPNLAAEGAISGTIAVTGTPSAPIVNFKANWSGAATSQTRAARLDPLGITASGRFADNRVTIDATASGRNGLSLRATGTAGQTLNIDATLSNLPAGLANNFVPDLAAEGTISGTVAVTGTPAAPVVNFRANWSGAATSQTRAAGLAPLTIAANGQFANNRVTIDTTATGGGGLSLRANGNVSIAGNRAIDMSVAGTLPFAALAAQLADQGLAMEGTANINLRIAGTTAAPTINGSVTTDGARLIDVRRNLAVNNLAVTVTLDGQQAVISRFSGRFASGGNITASGTIGIRPGSGFPVDISVRLDNATYVDGTLVVATVNGTLGLRGPILSNPTLSGALRLERASITVPERLPTSLEEINVQHRNAPPAVKAQLRNIGPQQVREKSTTIALDLRLDAPSQIFVRGRGIDAELGGSVTIRGTASAPQVSGGFTMRRGRLTILNRRLDFADRSKITFGGDLVPALDLEATSTSGSTTLIVDVTGLATDPSITFSSSPMLPQDEVLAQLIFGQSLSRLSPLQIAQLADAVSQLAGGRSTSLFNSLRSQLGVDNLDISTDASGQTRVSAGRYINDRTYIELQQTTSSGSKAVINLDVGRGVKLRGAAGANGAGEVGVVYEHEY